MFSAVYENASSKTANINVATSRLSNSGDFPAELRTYLISKGTSKLFGIFNFKLNSVARDSQAT